MWDRIGENQVYVQRQKAAEKQPRFDKTEKPSCLASEDNGGSVPQVPAPHVHWIARPSCGATARAASLSAESFRELSARLDPLKRKIGRSVPFKVTRDVIAKLRAGFTTDGDPQSDTPCALIDPAQAGFDSNIFLRPENGPSRPNALSQKPHTLQQRVPPILGDNLRKEILARYSNHLQTYLSPQRRKAAAPVLP